MEEKKIEYEDPIGTEDNIDFLKKRKEYAALRIKGFQFNWWILLISSIVGGFLGYSYVSIYPGKDNSSFFEVFPYLVIGAISSGFLYFYLILIIRMKYQNIMRRIDYRLVQLGAEELQQNIEENFFTKLVKINFKYIDQYYMQTQQQADKSFILASAASIVGLIIISAGIIMMFLDENRKAPAILTAASGVITELVAALFFYLYNKTILKMSQYHQKLVITQNISLALKITEDMEIESKSRVQEQIIDRLTTDINKYLTSNE